MNAFETRRLTRILASAAFSLACIRGAVGAPGGRVPPNLVTSDVGLGISGETTPSGTVRAELAPAPDAPKGLWSVRLVYRLREHRRAVWLDAAYVPAPPLDLSAHTRWRLWIRAEQPADYLTLKIVDADNPPPNHSALESKITDRGKALPVHRWVPVDVVLPNAAARRDAVTWFGFYIAASNTRVPLDRDLVFYVGRFPLRIPPRAPWPPKKATKGGTLKWETVWSGPLEAKGPWVLVRGKDNQNDHPARFANGGVEFDSDALGWNEFLWSDPKRLHLTPGVRYRLRFDYHVIRAPEGRTAGDDGYFYFLVRARGTIKEDVGWQKWRGFTGTRGMRYCTFIPHALPDYYLIFGVRHRGAVRIENLRIEKAVSEKHDGKRMRR